MYREVMTRFIAMSVCLKYRKTAFQIHINTHVFMECVLESKIYSVE